MTFLRSHSPHKQFVTIIVTFVVLLLSTASSGAQWIKATLPAPYSIGYYLDIFFLESDPRYGWACSIEGYVVRTTDGGVTWAGSRTSRQFLESVQFLTPRIGYTSGPAGIYRSDDGGASWRDITPLDPNGEKSWGCYFINENEGVYLVGGCATGLQAFYRTTNGGSSWSVSYGTISQSGLSDAIINRDGTGMAVSSGYLWQTSDYGRSWKVYVSTGARLWTEELAIFGRSILLPTSGSNCDGQDRGVGTLKFSTDRGNSFRDFRTGANMFGTFLLDENRGWGVGDGSAVYYTSDAGRNWELKNCGITGDMDDVFFISDTLGWIAGNGLYRTNFNSFKIPVVIQPDTSFMEICKGDSVLLTVTSGFSTYTWNDGVRTSTRFATDSGDYIITAFDKFTCQESLDTIHIAFKPSIDPEIIADKKEICEGDSITLTLKGAFVSQQWSSGDTSRSIVVRTGGRYQITVVDQFGCTLRSPSVNLIVHPNPRPNITANRRTTICLDESIMLSAPPGFAGYQWNTGESTPSITTDKAGAYTVTVVDEFGCTGTAAAITVIVLNTRNKINVEITSADGDFVIADHDVGQMACKDLLIRNVSTNEVLTISSPLLMGNVFCSIPRSQLPLVIDPLSTAKLSICISAVDTGYVRDTLMLPDTCSPTFVPIRSFGLPYGLDGTSRCDVPANTLIYRAGSSYRLSAPYPMPTRDMFTVQMTPKMEGVSMKLVNTLGVEQKGEWGVVDGSENMSIWFDTRNVPSGTYHAVAYAGDEPIHTWTVTVFR